MRTLKRLPAVDGLVRVLLVGVILLSGCVGELLAPEAVTIRTVSCAFLDPLRSLHLVHHVAGPVSVDVLQSASASWAGAVAPVMGRQPDRFSWETEPTGLPAPEERAAWARQQTVISDDRLHLHAVWVERLEAGRSVEELSPGFALINASAIVEATARGHNAETVTRALLFHGLGHVLGVVNRGVPLHDPAGPLREQPMHHEPGGVMSASWHHVATFPSNATARSYSDALIQDWQHAQQEVCP